MSTVQTKSTTRPVLPLPVQAASTNWSPASSMRATRSSLTSPSTSPSTSPPTSRSDDDYDADTSSLSTTGSGQSAPSLLPPWLHRLDILGPSYRRHAPATLNAYHPAHAQDVQRPYQPTVADLQRCTWAAVGTQVGLAYFGMQLALDMTFPRGPSPFNPSGQRALVAGIVLLGVSVPGLFCSGSALANALVGLTHAACRHDRTVVQNHPRAAVAGSYAMATTVAVAGVVGSSLWIYALMQQGRRGEIDDATWSDLASLPLLTMTLSVSLLPVAAWYVGQGLGAVAGAATGAVGQRWGAPQGPIALD